MRGGNLGGLVDRASEHAGAGDLGQQLRRHALRPDRRLRVKLLLEASRGLGAQPEGARGAEDVDAVPACDLEQHPGGLVRDLRDLATHDPSDARGAVAVADEHGLRVEFALDAVEGGHLLAGGGGAHDQLAASDPVEVEGVERLRGQQHHVVGDVDDVGDRALPGGHQPGLEPGRRRAHVDIGEDARGEPGAEVGHLDLDRGVVGGLPVSGRLGVLGPGRWRQLGAGDRMNLACNPVDPEAVDPVRVQVQLEHSLGDRQHIRQRRAGSGAFVENDDPIRVLADLELSLTQHHPVGDDAAQLRSAELGAVGHDGPGEGHRHRLAGGDVGGAADDRVGAVARIDLADLEPIGVWVLFGRENPADDEPLIRRHADAEDALDLDRAHRQQLRHLGDRQRRIAVLAQPAERHPHDRPPLTRTAPACGRRYRRTSAGRGRRA